ncbi:hypothetical protein STSP2_00611 [Anaerohalosphaera lusitana]|uniref:Uncharacterized protein n=1 Tax=Anaerohalosphaera lusitana TaxID=1936003 RepID=A0A1U9NIB1_9BACT|nr:hypothetical protein [Anaerohalosphaera lusitana]AQT67464.1 hypothetical protein STSP2_00611 [Anaerohalosphaera lusitana]
MDLEQVFTIAPMLGMAVYIFLMRRNRKKHGLNKKNSLLITKKPPYKLMLFAILSGLAMAAVSMYVLVKDGTLDADVAILSLSLTAIFGLGVFMFFRVMAQRELKKAEQLEDNDETEQNPQPPK